MNDTENKVKSKIESYEIKTTSTDILNAYNKEKEVKNRKPFFFHKSFFKIALPVSLSLASLIIAFSVYININKPGSNDNGNDFVTLNTKDNNLLNKEVNLLAYGLNNKANYSTNNMETILSNSFNSNNPLEDDSDPVTTTLGGYQDKVDKLDTTALAFYYLDNKLDTKISSIDYTKNIKYVNGNKTYKRKSEYYLNNTKIYDFYYEINESTDEDKNKWNLTGIIVEKDNTYLVSSLKEKETSTNEYEIKTTFYDSQYTYLLKKEVDNEESEYKFTKVNNSTKEKSTFSIEKDILTNESEIVIDNKDEYTYNLTLQSENNYLVESEEYQFTLVYKDSNRIYTSSEFGSITK